MERAVIFLHIWKVRDAWSRVSVSGWSNMAANTFGQRRLLITVDLVALAVIVTRQCGGRCTDLALGLSCDYCMQFYVLSSPNLERDSSEKLCVEQVEFRPRSFINFRGRTTYMTHVLYTVFWLRLISGSRSLFQSSNLILKTGMNSIK